MNDKVFGELTFNNGWERELVCDFWKQTKVKIRVSAYENEEPNEMQKNAFNRFVEDKEDISRLTFEKLEKYLSVIADDIVAYAGLSEMPKDIMEIVSINHILFMESGNFAIICDATWDDHGVAVLCTETEIIAGPQDIVWIYE